MDQLSPLVRPALDRLRRRLAAGLFLEIWPAWASVGFVVAGTVALVCRIFFFRVAPFLPWLLLAPIVVALPVIVICLRRAYRPGEIAALADWLGGGHGVLLTLVEKNDPAWAASPLMKRASTFTLPRFRFRRAILLLAPAMAFLIVPLLLPQRMPGPEVSSVLAEQLAANLTTAVVELKKQDLITQQEEQELKEEIEKIRKDTEKRLDASSWESADAMRERMIAGLSEKQEAVKWAQESLARLAAAAAGDAAAGSAEAAGDELSKALEKMAQSGLLAGAPAGLREQLKAGKLPTDPAALRALAAELGKYLADTNQRFAATAALGRDFGRFDPAEFPIESSSGPNVNAPGRGGVDRGRGDADLTWGQQTEMYDKFKSKPLPPGAARSPDDWSPVVTLPGAPQEGAVLSSGGAARQYADDAGQGAWRRSLAPRHQSAVKKYFGNTVIKKDR